MSKPRFSELCPRAASIDAVYKLISCAMKQGRSSIKILILNGSTNAIRDRLYKDNFESYGERNVDGGVLTVINW